MTRRTHLPLPWRESATVDGSGDVVIRTASGLRVCETWGHSAGADAAFIVRACNSHHKLLAALKGLHDEIAEYARINNLGGFENHWMKAAREAIAEAEAL